MGLLILSTLINCVLAVGIYLLEKYTALKKWRRIVKQIIIGVLFGLASAFASSFGVEWLGAVVNVRDAAPLSAGLIFGGTAGIIAGSIGGLGIFITKKTMDLVSYAYENGENILTMTKKI